MAESFGSKKLSRKDFLNDFYASISADRVLQLRLDLQKVERLNILVFNDLNFLTQAINSFLAEIDEFNPNVFKNEYLGITVTAENRAKVIEEVKSTLNFFKYSIRNKLSKNKRNWNRHIRTQILGPAHEDVFNTTREPFSSVRIAVLKRLEVTDKPMYIKLLKKVGANKNTFLIKNFRKAAELKSEIVDYVFNQAFKNLSDSQEKLVALVKSGVHRGHGAGAGSAVSYIAVAEASGALNELGQEDLIDYISKGLNASIPQTGITVSANDLQDIENIITNWRSVVDPNTGKVDALYVPYIQFQDRTSNSSVDSRREKLVAQLVRDYFNKVPASYLFNLHSSASLKEQMTSVAIAPIFKNQISSKNIRKKVKISKEYSVSGGGLRLKGKQAYKNKISRRAPTYTTVNSKISKPATRSVNTSNIKPPSKQPAFNELQLVGILNASLPPIVRKNMQFPALQNRTGLFSESVKVVSIDQTPKGFPSISYTYDKIPYQVFEMGIGKEPWATPERDPRKLIDKSVRELAAEYMTQRFYTKRV